MPKHFMPGGLSWKPDILSERTEMPLCQLREEAGLVRDWHQNRGMGHPGWGARPDAQGVCVNTSILDSWLSSAPRCKLVMV